MQSKIPIAKKWKTFYKTKKLQKIETMLQYLRNLMFLIIPKVEKLWLNSEHKKKNVEICICKTLIRIKINKICLSVLDVFQFWMITFICPIFGIPLAIPTLRNLLLWLCWWIGPGLFFKSDYRKIEKWSLMHVSNYIVFWRFTWS